MNTIFCCSGLSIFNRLPIGLTKTLLLSITYQILHERGKSDNPVFELFCLITKYAWVSKRREKGERIFLKFKNVGGHFQVLPMD